MAIVVDQNIPSEYYVQYNNILTASYTVPTVPGKGVVQSNGGPRIGGAPSAAQLKVRQAFKDSCACWWKQKNEGTSWPPDVGPRDIVWWSLESQYWEMMIFHYYMYLSISPFYNDEEVDWCIYGPKRDTHIFDNLPDDNFWNWEETRIAKYHDDWRARMFIMKEESEYDYTYLHLYVTDHMAGNATHNSIIAVWDIRQNFFQEKRVTWNNQPYWYDMLTYQTITSDGWIDIYTGKDWHAFGIMLFNESELPVENIYDVTFASMQYPIEGLRPLWYN